MVPFEGYFTFVGCIIVLPIQGRSDLTRFVAIGRHTALFKPLDWTTVLAQ